MTEHKLIVAGKRVETGNLLSSRDWQGRETGRVHMAGETEIENALIAAHDYFRKFATTPAAERQAVLFRAAALLREKAEDFARIITSEVYKPIKLARGEVARAAKTFELAACALEESVGQIIRLDTFPGHPHRTGLARLFPKGPVLAISPFNFPLNLAVHKIAPAIAVGAPVILKPASSAPITGLMIGELLLGAGLQEPAISVLPTKAALAEKMAMDERIKVVSFTGSDEIGWRLKSLLPKKTVMLELGGNAGVIVHQDADPAHAAERCVTGAYSYSGQVCISVQRIFVHQEIRNEFLRVFSEKTISLRMGDPLSEETDIGPMITEADARRVGEWVSEAVSGGGVLLFGGKRDGAFYEPALVENCPRTARLWKDEAFGPVATLNAYRDFGKALEAVNDSRFGLQAGVFTSDINLAMKAFETIEAGGVILNDVPTFRVDRMPYGGVKDSGMGREGPHYAVAEMCELRLLVI
ncbi:MAG: aldehyde dehydrogenase family protein [candidate division WOR-3 bacterium]